MREDEGRQAWDRFARAAEHGFRADEVPGRGFAAKPGCHDDGPGHGLFLGPVGGPAFSRDLHGHFSRWHLQPGTHLVGDVDAAFLAIHWKDGARHRFARLRREDASEHRVASLHPASHELFCFDDAPFRVLLTAFSPVLPGAEELAGLPVVVLDVEVCPLDDERTLPPVDIAAFWPNLNGWRASLVTTAARGDVAWPGDHHAGNANRVTDGPSPGTGVLQSRLPATPDPEDVCGDVAVTVGGDADGFGRQVQFGLHGMATGVSDPQQDYTLAAVARGFGETGRLGVTPDSSWQAHWHEPVGSAVAARHNGGKRRVRTRFVLAFDWPVVRFGQGRCWYRRYAAAGEEQGQDRAARLADRAHREGDEWLAAIDSWHARTIGELTTTGWSPRVAGCVVNELNLVTSLGSAWLHGTPERHRPPDSPLRGDEHLGILEGYDTGYFYYDTSDLWHYAFPALSLTWPRLADLVFRDLGTALDAEVTTERPIYRPAQHRPLLSARKLPHDLGSAAEDPFVRLNGYAMRDDPNTWRDSNPAFVLATLAHHRLLDRPVDDPTWDRLTAAAELAAEQAEADTAVPRHDEFGDSTWDNLGLRGYSTYTVALCAGMWAVLARESRRRGEDADPYEARLRAARTVLDELWNGSFYRAATEGKYTEAVMPDSLMGVFYADVCGAREVLPGDRVTSHLLAAYELAYRSYGDGRVGPLLVAEPGLHRYDRDGGQELQVNEVIVGSGWMFAAMLAKYGLREQAGAVAGSLAAALYGGTGLQFRTPAAVDAAGWFRAPLNMRPLAAWWLAAAGRERT